MEKRYVVKNFNSGLYFAGHSYGWSAESYLIEYFYDIKDALDFIATQDGKFLIETVYVV